MDLATPRFMPLALAVLLSAAVLAGCGGPPAVEEPVEDRSELPRWVRIVPVESEGRSWFVGAVSMASSREEAIRQARLDALSQVSRSARQRFASLIAKANAGSGVTLTPIERFQLTDAGREMYASRVEEAAVMEGTHVEPCIEGLETACQTYVLVGVPVEAWDRELSETLQKLRREEAEAGRETGVEYLDWMLRHQERSSR
ncbi:MAG: hypothetical protein GF405_09260 [Candidatus Eisenbacteria bacterium]|nr:hypothetical protein [Candidatus Eisenbacteria bacterium]